MKDSVRTRQGSEQVNGTEGVPKAASMSLSTENVSKGPCRAWLLSKFVLLSNDPETELPQSPQNLLPSTQGLRHGRLPPSAFAKQLSPQTPWSQIRAAVLRMHTPQAFTVSPLPSRLALRAALRCHLKMYNNNHLVPLCGCVLSEQGLDTQMLTYIPWSTASDICLVNLCIHFNCPVLLFHDNSLVLNKHVPRVITVRFYGQQAAKARITAQSVWLSLYWALAETQALRVAVYMYYLTEY